MVPSAQGAGHGELASLVNAHVLVRGAAYLPFQRSAGSADRARVDDDGVTLRCGSLPRRTARGRRQRPIPAEPA